MFFLGKLPLWKLTWNLKMMVSNRNLPFQWFIFRWTMLVFRGVSNYLLIAVNVCVFSQTRNFTQSDGLTCQLWGVHELRPQFLGHPFWWRRLVTSRTRDILPPGKTQELRFESFSGRLDAEVAWSSYTISGTAMHWCFTPYIRDV